MAAPTYIGVGTGVAITGASGTVSKTSCTAGNLVLVQVLVDGTGQNPTFSAITNIENLAGTGNALTTPGADQFSVGSPEAALQAIRVGRVITNGTVSVDVNITSNDMFTRIYEWSGVHAGATWDDIAENGDGNPNQTVATNATAQTGTVTTTGDDRVILALTALNDDGLALDLYDPSWSGTHEQFESATGTQGTIDLQQKPAPTAGSFGSNTDGLLASAAWGCLTFALIPGEDAPAPTADDAPIPILGWGAA